MKDDVDWRRRLVGVLEVFLERVYFRLIESGENFSSVVG